MHYLINFLLQIQGYRLKRKFRSASEVKKVLRGKEANFRIFKTCLKNKLFLFKIKILDCSCVFQMNHLINEISPCKRNVFPTPFLNKTDSIDFKLREVVDCFCKLMPCPLLIRFKV